MGGSFDKPSSDKSSSSGEFSFSESDENFSNGGTFDSKNITTNTTTSITNHEDKLDNQLRDLAGKHLKNTKMKKKTEKNASFDESKCDLIASKLIEVIMTNSLLMRFPETRRDNWGSKVLFNFVIYPIVYFKDCWEDFEKVVNTQDSNNSTLSATRRDKKMLQSTKITKIRFSMSNPALIFQQALNLPLNHLEQMKQKLKLNPLYCFEAEKSETERQLFGNSDPLIIPMSIKLLGTETNDFDIPITVNIENVLFSWEEICEQSYQRFKESTTLAKKTKLKMLKKAEENQTLGITPSDGYVSIEDSEEEILVTNDSECNDPHYHCEHEDSLTASSGGVNALQKNLAIINMYSKYICPTGDFERDYRRIKQHKTTNRPKLTKTKSSNINHQHQPLDDRSIIFLVTTTKESKMTNETTSIGLKVRKNVDQVGYELKISSIYLPYLKNPGGSSGSRLSMPTQEILDFAYSQLLGELELKTLEFEVAKGVVELFFKSHEIHYLNDEIIHLVDKLNRGHSKRKDNTDRPCIPIKFIGYSSNDGIAFKLKENTIYYKYDTINPQPELQTSSTPQQKKLQTQSNEPIKILHSADVTFTTEVDLKKFDFSEEIESSINVSPILAVPKKSCEISREILSTHLYSKLKYANFENPLVQIGYNPETAKEYLETIAKTVERNRNILTTKPPNSTDASNPIIQDFVTLKPIILTFEMEYIKITEIDHNHY